MSHPATSIRGVTFVQNAGQPTERIVTKTSVPLLRRRLTTGQPEEVLRTFNLAMEDMHAATLGARSIPFGGPIVVLQGVGFTLGGADAKLAHRLKSAKTILLTLAQPRVLTAGTPFAWVVAVDDTNITLRPLGTFTADVVLGVGP